MAAYYLIPQIMTAKTAEIRRKNLDSIWSSETQLSQKILIACLYHLERLSIKPKQKPNKYALFFGKMAKQGYTAKEIAELWKSRCHK